MLSLCHVFCSLFRDGMGSDLPRTRNVSGTLIITGITGVCGTVTDRSLLTPFTRCIAALLFAERALQPFPPLAVLRHIFRMAASCYARTRAARRARGLLTRVILLPRARRVTAARISLYARSAPLRGPSARRTTRLCWHGWVVVAAARTFPLRAHSPFYNVYYTAVLLRCARSAPLPRHSLAAALRFHFTCATASYFTLCVPRSLRLPHCGRCAQRTLRARRCWYNSSFVFKRTLVRMRSSLYAVRLTRALRATSRGHSGRVWFVIARTLCAFLVAFSFILVRHIARPAFAPAYHSTCIKSCN